MTKPKREVSPCRGCDTWHCLGRRSNQDACFGKLSYTIRRLRREKRDMKRAMSEWCHQNCGGSENESNPCKTCPMRKFTKGGKG